MRNENVKSEFDIAYINHIQNIYKKTPLSKAAVETFENAYANLGRQKQPTAAMKTKKTVFRVFAGSASSLAACFVFLFLLNVINPVAAESIPIVGPVIKNINSSFKVVNSGTKSPMGTNLDTYAVTPVDKPMAAEMQTEYKIEVQSVYSDGEYAHASLIMKAPTGTDETYNNFFTCGTTSADGEECPSGLFDSGGAENGLARFVLTGDADTYIGTVASKLPKAYQMGDIIDFKVDITDFYGIYHDIEEMERMQREKGFGNTGDSTLAGLEVEIPEFSANIPITVDTSSNYDFDTNVQSNGLSLYHVISTPTYTAFELDMPEMVETEDGSHQMAVEALFTEDGQELSRNYNLFGDRSGGVSEDGTVTCEKIAFDGTPSGNKMLILRWYTDYDYQNVIAEYTIDLEAKAAAASETYKDESSPLYLKNPNMFTSARWNVITKEISLDDPRVKEIDGEIEKIYEELDDTHANLSEEEIDEVYKRISKLENERSEIYYEKNRQETAKLIDWQNDFGLQNLNISNDQTDSYVDVTIYKKGGYRDISIQVLAGDRLVASCDSFDGTKYTDYALKTGYFDERDDSYYGGTPYYVYRINYNKGDITAKDEEITIKALDKSSGEVLMETTVTLEFEWGLS